MALHCGPPGQVLRNRERFLSALGMDAQALVCARQVHGAQIRLVEPADRGKGAVDPESALPDTDALITAQRGIPIAIFTADCLPVFLSAPEVPGIGLVHAGWRGTAAGIVTRTLERMCREFGIAVPQVYAVFGPAIRACCYEVGAEFQGTFPAHVQRRNERLFCDLIAANTAQLLSAGVPAAHISDSGICTACFPETYFSHRRRPDTAGRMMSVMMLI